MFAYLHATVLEYISIAHTYTCKKTTFTARICPVGILHGRCVLDQ